MKKLFGIMVVLLAFLVGGTAHADSMNVFEVTVHPPASQSNPEVSYLDLELPPQANETVTISIKNASDQPLNVKPSFNRAATNNLGVIEYSGKRAETLENVPVNIKELVTFDEAVIELAPQEERNVTAEITMPAEEFSGVLAGGFYFEQVPEGEIQGGVRNIYSRETAVLIRNDQTPVEPELEIVSAKPMQENGRNMIELTIDNPQAAYVHNLKIEHNVEAGDEDFLTGEKEGMSVAPTSQFKYIMPLDGKEFKNGQHTVNITATAGDKTWTGSPTFMIERQEASALNEQDVTIERQSFPWWMLLIAGFILVQTIIIVVLVKRRKRVE